MHGLKSTQSKDFSLPSSAARCSPQPRQPSCEQTALVDILFSHPFFSRSFEI